MLPPEYRPAQVGIAIIILGIVVLPFLLSVQAQNTITFLPTDTFSIPELDGSINFAINGSCRSAVLENNTWIFRGLVLNNSQTRGNLQISTDNSNITITDFRSNSAFGRSQYLRYISEGQGVQIINFGINSTTNAADWMVTLNRTQFLTAGEGWYLQRDNTVVVNGQTGNITVIHYTYDDPNNSNLPFYEQHSVALTIGVVITVTILVAALISIKTRR
ncbi:MAG: hypothetical protein LBH74_06645 [Nitrososphaerota archaeon]|nr:hypothetical protein [Nitrososphaerota archaeon]